MPVPVNSPHRRKLRWAINIRGMEIDHLAQVFHLGERPFTAEEVPNVYRTWDEHEVMDLFHSDAELSLVAEEGQKLVGFAMGTTVTKSSSAWKYDHLVWLGWTPTTRARVWPRSCSTPCWSSCGKTA